MDRHLFATIDKRHRESLRHAKVAGQHSLHCRSMVPALVEEHDALTLPGKHLAFSRSHSGWTLIHYRVFSSCSSQRSTNSYPSFLISLLSRGLAVKPSTDGRAWSGSPW